MSKGFRQSQATLHTWSGLVVGWVLFAIFVAGTTAYWREALNRWTRPELARIESPERVVRGAVAFLAQRAPNAQSWFIEVPTARSAGAHVFWQPQSKPGQPRRRGRRDTQALIGADGRPVSARETRGGDFFYRFHFDLHYMPVLWARWLVGMCALFMLVAILSGIVTHKKIFKDFFTFRRGKGQRTWLDGHNAAAVLGLPFHLMITYTGLVTLMAMLMPWAVVANYVSEDTYFDAVFPSAPAVERLDRPAPLVDLVVLMRDAETQLGGPIGRISVSQPGDAAAQVTLSKRASSTLSARGPEIVYDGVSGKVVWRSPSPHAASATGDVMVGLHAGRFAGDAMRWIYFLCGVGGSVMIGSGLVLWIVKRRDKLPDPSRPHFGFRLVEKLNIGFIAGFPAGIVGFLWANRLLPIDMAQRAQWEIHTLFIVWGVCLLHAFVRRAKAAWVEQFAVVGAALLALPVYNVVATPRGVFATAAAGDWTLAAADLTLAVFGLACGWMAWRIRIYTPPVRKAKAPRRAAAPARDMPVTTT